MSGAHSSDPTQEPLVNATQCEATSDGNSMDRHLDSIGASPKERFWSKRLRTAMDRRGLQFSEGSNDRPDDDANTKRGLYGKLA